MVIAAFLLRKPKVEQMSFAHGIPELEFSYMRLMRDSYFLRCWLFMFLNISSGLCLIPLAKQMMKDTSVGYSEGVITTVIALSGLMNGGGRFLFAWWSDRLAHRVNILLFILSISAGVMLLSPSSPPGAWRASWATRWRSSWTRPSGGATWAWWRCSWRSTSSTSPTPPRSAAADDIMSHAFEKQS